MKAIVLTGGGQVHAVFLVPDSLTKEDKLAALRDWVEYFNQDVDVVPIHRLRTQSSVEKHICWLNGKTEKEPLNTP